MRYLCKVSVVYLQWSWWIFHFISLNQISSVVPDEPEFLRHVTQLDVRDNRLTELDVSVFPRLEVLHCQRNRLTRLRLRGCALKALYASNNGSAHTIMPHINPQHPTARLMLYDICFTELQELDMSPVASNLTYVDISRLLWLLSLASLSLSDVESLKPISWHEVLSCASSAVCVCFLTGTVWSLCLIGWVTARNWRF